MSMRTAPGEFVFLPTPEGYFMCHHGRIQRIESAIMVANTTRYGLRITVPLDHEHAIARVKDALAAEGFGILCEIDVAATLKKKLGVDFMRYVILGACNPPLAHRALLAEPEVGLLLPCNVVVYDDEVPDRSVVSAIDPLAAFSLSDNSALRSVASEVRERLIRALGTMDTEHAANPDERNGVFAHRDRGLI